jgi:hypothetical protein
MKRIHYLGTLLVIVSIVAVVNSQVQVSSPIPVATTATAAIGAGTAPSYAEMVGGQYNTTVPAPTAAQTVGLQLAPNGSLLVQPYRRSQTGVATGSIASTTAATMIAAGSSGVYNDITELVLSLSAETTAAYITVNVSDGTNTYKFGIASEAVGTAGSGSWPVVITFNPPLPATSSATAWTIALSAADATVQYTVEYVKQTANF